MIQFLVEEALFDRLELSDARARAELEEQPGELDDPDLAEARARAAAFHRGDG